MVQNCVIGIDHLLNGWRGKKCVHNFDGRHLRNSHMEDGAVE